MSDDTFVEDHRRGRHLMRVMRSGETKVRWGGYGGVATVAFRGGDSLVEAVCDACQSEGVNASTCSAASFLDACFPADVVRVCMVSAAGPLKRLDCSR